LRGCEATKIKQTAGKIILLSFRVESRSAFGNRKPFAVK
jgi:hypothetical protein